MDNHSNMDGLDGLPMDLWLNQQHSDSNMTSSIFHHPSATPMMRDYLSVTPRTTPAAFDDSLAPIIQNSHMMSAYGHSVPTQSNQAERQAPLERSAWSQFMSLDQGMGSYGTQESIRLLQNRYSPLDEYKSREESFKPTSMTTSFPSGTLPRLPSASINVGNFSPMSFLNPSQDKVSQLNELMNLKKTTKTQSLTISTDVSSLESSGDYSPVSPPATISDQLSSINSNRVAETMRDDAISSNYVDTADIFSYFSNKSESLPFSRDKLSYSQPSHVTTANNLPSPSDVPLDMTKVISSKEDTTQSSMPKLISSHFEYGSNSSQSMTSAGNERSPLLQTLLCKGQLNTSDVTDMKPTQQQLTFSPQIKFIQPVKSTPKKSNFYGRDASLFSFPLENKTLGSPHLTEGVPGSMDSNQMFSFDDSIKNVNTRDEDFVDDNEESEEANDKADNGNNMNINVETNQAFSTNDHSLLAESKVLLNSMETSDLGSDLVPCGLDSSNLQSVDTFIENATRKEVGNDEMHIDQIESLEDNKNEPEQLLHSNNLLDDTLNSTVINDTTEPDDTTLLPPETYGKGKRKKRKGVGIKTKPRKQPARKRGRPQRISVNLSVETNEIVDASADNGDVVQTEDVVVGPQRIRKKRGAPQPQSPNLDVAPRRSSSRKSKDNAMRLIELQADSNYSGIRQPEEEIPLEKKTIRKAKKNANKLSALEDELSDISDNNSFEDKSDDEYVIDEEEAQAVDKDDMDVLNEKNKKAKDKKIGGLKMSIKLSGNSSAEIVSGIEDTPVKRKRKLAKKKSEKNKAKVKKLDLDKAEELQSDNLQAREETVQETKEEFTEGPAADMTEKHMSLLQKYFSTASSATAARQTNKNSMPGKIKKLKKKNDIGGSNKSKVGNPGKVKTGPKQKTSVKFNLDEETKSLEDNDSSTPKFVCGYCPLRYHSKQDLMTHMEAHMVEMEGKDSTPPVIASEDKKKDADSQPISRDPRANRLGSSPSANQAVKAPQVEKAKTRPFTETVKENKPETFKNKFKCGECNQLFNSKPNLLDHVRIHTADKPFECDICHKCFTERNLLSAHRKTHVQEKLLRCHMCSKAFVDKADLSYHMQSHPKRSMTNSSGKMSFNYKKGLKKTVLETPEKDTSSIKTPTSFASALSGEPEISGSANPLVILLKRGDTPNTSLAGKNSVLDSKGPSKSSHTAVASQKVTVNASDHKQQESEKLDVGSKAKDLNSQTAIQTQQNISTTVLSKAEEKTLSEVCSCKECPDCVTRFLQSFDC